MWSPRRHALPALVVLAALAACGFTPVYAPGGTGAALSGQVAITAPHTVEGYYLQEAIEERLGRSPAPAYGLAVTLSLTSRNAALASDGTLLREAVSGTADWQLTSAQGPMGSGSVTSFASWSTGGSTVAASTAEAAARERLAVQLADLIVARLLALPSP